MISPCQLSCTGYFHHSRRNHFRQAKHKFPLQQRSPPKAKVLGCFPNKMDDRAFSKNDYQFGETIILFNSLKDQSMPTKKKVSTKMVWESCELTWYVKGLCVCTLYTSQVVLYKASMKTRSFSLKETYISSLKKSALWSTSTEPVRNSRKSIFSGVFSKSELSVLFWKLITLFLRILTCFSVSYHVIACLYLALEIIEIVRALSLVDRRVHGEVCQ